MRTLSTLELDPNKKSSFGCKWTIRFKVLSTRGKVGLKTDGIIYKYHNPEKFLILEV